MENSKKIVISGYYGFDNFGDEGILSVLLDHFIEKTSDITVISHNPTKTSKTHQVKSIYTFNFAKIINEIKTCDVLISGGGSLLQDVTSAKSLVYYLLVILTAIFFKKDVIIFAQGIGPVNNPVLSLITKLTLKKCKYLSVRDDKSLYMLRGWGLTPERVNEPMWNVALPPYNPQNTVGIQLRGWKKLSDDFLISLAKYTAENFSSLPVKIISFQDSIDLEVCKKFEQLLKLANPKQKTEILSGLSNNDILRQLSSLSYLIAMRFHACLMGIKYGIKTLALSYDVKVETLAQAANIPCVNIQDRKRLKNGFMDLKIEDKGKLTKWAENQKFDFSNIDKLIFGEDTLEAE